MQVIVSPKVQDYLDSLVPILYEKEYFGFVDSATTYVHELLDDIKTNLPKRLHKPAPAHFDKYGKGLYYASFRKNNQTEWYAFFSKHNENGEIVYFVRHVENNHTAARYL